MILRNKINLIWYGRGNLTQESDCDSFDLQTTSSNTASDPSSLIETVYKIKNTAEGDSAWQEWSSSDFLGQGVVDGPFTKLECGQLYLVIMQGTGEDIKEIDIPEAITASDNPTTSIDDEALIISPDNDDGDEDAPTPTPLETAFECLPDGDTDEWKIFVPSTGDDATEMSNNASDPAETFTYSGFLAGYDLNWKFAMEDGVSMTTASSGEVGVDFNMDLGTNTPVLKIDGMEVADDTKFRIELISMTEKSGQDNVVEGTDASNPVGCWEGTSTGNVVNLTRVEGSETTNTNTGNTNTGNTNTEDNEYDTGIWADNAECLGFQDDDAVGLFRVRYKHNDETYNPSFESNFQLTKKTADGEVIVPDDDGVYEVTKSMIDDANESEDVNLQVDFSFVFTYSESDTTTPSLFIGYPVGEGVTNKITFQGTGQTAGIITVNRLNIFDADRDAGSCAEFTEADQNQFVGSSMV